MQREKWIIDKIKNKDVLDIGSIGQSEEYSLWKLLDKNSKTLTGVDLPTATESLKNDFKLNKTAYAHENDDRIFYGNMESINLNKKFDIVVAGDVIEHVSNQGLFLDNIQKHLKDNGTLIITTPNAKWLTVIFKPNITHTLWHDKYTLEILLNRHNFKIDDFKYYVGNKPHYNLIKRLLAFRQSIYVACSKSTPDNT